MVCQPSYPLNSENASPFATLRVYRSWAEIAAPTPKTASATVTPTLIAIFFPFIAHLLDPAHEHTHIIGSRMLSRHYTKVLPDKSLRVSGSVAARPALISCRRC